MLSHATKYNFAQCIIAGSAAFVSSAALAQSPTALPGFKLSVFAPLPTGMTAPDSVLVVGDRVWIGFGDGAAKDGSSGTSTVVEFSKAGALLHTYTVPGHNDGVRLDPNNGKVIALQNEDANPALVEIDPKAGTQTAQTLLKSVNGGGGYDDVAYIGGRAFASASNPTLNAAGINRYPAIVNVIATSHGLKTETLLDGDATAYNSVTGRFEKLNLTDPDSMTVTPAGDILMTDQADAQLILVRLGSSAGPFVSKIPLLGGVQVDDTVFATSQSGALIFTDTSANVIYKLTSNQFALGQPYSASTGVPAAPPAPAVPAFVGQLYMDSGAVRPIVTGLGAPHGMGFIARGK